jgi:predicted RNase H-like HicB family nuclease
MKFNLEKYPFRVYQELEDGENYYIVEFYDYPMCVGTGDTLEAAHQEALIALQNQFDALLEEGYQPTPPNPMFTKEFSGRFTREYPLLFTAK